MRRPRPGDQVTYRDDNGKVGVVIAIFRDLRQQGEVVITKWKGEKFARADLVEDVRVLTREEADA